MNPPSTGPNGDLARFAIVILFTLVVAGVLGESYDIVSRVAGANWLAAASIHSVLSLAAIGFLWLRRKERRSELLPKSQLLPLGSSRSLSGYFPALVVVTGAVMLVTVSSLLGGGTTRPVSNVQYSWILWVPVVEEIVFRLGFGSIFRGIVGPFWGAWFSSILFALAHSDPTISNIFTLKIGLPVGPFLLGLVAEWILHHSRSIWPVIFFHAACNSTVVIFSYMDARWLQWLGMLYG